jgi:hypothetical protein
LRWFWLPPMASGVWRTIVCQQWCHGSAQDVTRRS